jgi:threo-3-hydroxy-L-aspartate ammonia-lyase
MLTWDEIQKAAKRLKDVAHRTPVLHSSQFDERAGCQVFFKAENFQRGGAFKFRGAYNKISASLEKNPVSAVVAFSSGNHAQAVALSAKLLNLAATIVVPSDAPAAKIEATRGYGAQIVFYDRYRESREEIGKRIAAEQNALLVPPFDDYLVMAGQATAALELLQDIPDLDSMITPVSGNGLIAGTATAAKHLNPDIQVYGAEPEAGNDTYLSLKKGERVAVPVPHTIADGLQTVSPGALTFPIVQKLVSDILLVSDQQLVAAILFLLERLKILVEPSGAAGAAAVFFRKLPQASRKVGVILSGGNIDLLRLKEFLQAY